MPPEDDRSSAQKGASAPSAEVFRQRALDQLSSPDRLNEMMRLTRPISWLALAGIAMLLVSAMAWGIFGRLAVSVDGSGILLSGSGVLQVAASEGGVVEEVLVGVGDRLEPGQVLARLANARLESEVTSLASEVAATEASLRELETRTEIRGAELKTIVEGKRQALEASIASLEGQSARLAEKVASLGGGARTEAQAELDAVDERLSMRKVELSDLELAVRRDLREARAPVDSLRLEMQRLEQRLEARRQTLAAQSRVLAPQGGRVIEVLADEGDLLESGAPILSVEQSEGELTAFLFVPATVGRTLQNGMTARIRLSDGQRDDKLYLLGEVVRVADYPTTRQAMMRLVANDAFVNDLLRGGPALEVEVQLARDQSSDTYLWSKTPASPRLLESGTLIRGSIVTDLDRPLAYVIPGLDSHFEP